MKFPVSEEFNTCIVKKNGTCIRQYIPHKSFIQILYKLISGTYTCRIVKTQNSACVKIKYAFFSILSR